VSQRPSSQPLAEEHESHLPLLCNTHAGEWIKVVYRQGEHYIPSAVAIFDAMVGRASSAEVPVIAEICAAMIDNIPSKIALSAGPNEPTSLIP
jgi:hypothetical protein